MSIKLECEDFKIVHFIIKWVKFKSILVKIVTKLILSIHNILDNNQRQFLVFMIKRSGYFGNPKQKSR